MHRTRILLFLLTVGLLIPQFVFSGDIEDRLSGYGKENARRYLQPLVDAIGTDLNASLFHSANIPRVGLYATVEIAVVCVLFGEDDRTFIATTEEGFSPQQKVRVPTIVGSGTAVEVEGDNGTSHYFTGGLELNSFALPIPQLRIGSIFGTEALFRYFALNSGGDDLGDFKYFGFGLRHDISNYLPVLPIGLSAGFFWQDLGLGKSGGGKDLISSTATSFGVCASRRIGSRFLFIEPYAGFSIDSFSTDVSYESDEEEIDLDFGTTSTPRITIGVAGRLGILTAYTDYNLAKQKSFSLGLGIGI